MEKENAEYIVRDFSAVDRQVEEMAKRERILTWRLRIENLKRLGVPMILLACALAIVIIALGVFIWLWKKEKVSTTISRFVVNNFHNRQGDNLSRLVKHVL